MRFLPPSRITHATDLPAWLVAVSPFCSSVPYCVLVIISFYRSLICLSLFLRLPDLCFSITLQLFPSFLVFSICLFHFFFKLFPALLSSFICLIWFLYFSFRVLTEQQQHSFTCTHTQTHTICIPAKTEALRAGHTGLNSCAGKENLVPQLQTHPKTLIITSIYIILHMLAERKAWVKSLYSRAESPLPSLMLRESPDYAFLYR